MLLLPTWYSRAPSSLPAYLPFDDRQEFQAQEFQAHLPTPVQGVSITRVPHVGNHGLEHRKLHHSPLTGVSWGLRKMTFCYGQLPGSRQTTLSRALVMLLLSRAGEGFSSRWCSKSQTGLRLHIQHADAQTKEDWFHWWFGWKKIDWKRQQVSM